MKNFIVARLGNYDENLNLSPAGEKQMRQLSQVLKHSLNENPILLLSSSAPRAVQSATVLGNEMGVSFESFDELWSDNAHIEDTERAIKLILERANGFENVVVMTHLEYSGSLPSVFARKEMGVSEFYSLGSVPKGSAWYVNCADRNYITIP